MHFHYTFHAEPWLLHCTTMRIMDVNRQWQPVVKRAGLCTFAKPGMGKRAFLPWRSLQPMVGTFAQKLWWNEPTLLIRGVRFFCCCNFQNMVSKLWNITISLLTGFVLSSVHSIHVQKDCWCCCYCFCMKIMCRVLVRIYASLDSRSAPKTQKVRK